MSTRNKHGTGNSKAVISSASPSTKIPASSSNQQKGKRIAVKIDSNSIGGNFEATSINRMQQPYNSTTSETFPAQTSYQHASPETKSSEQEEQELNIFVSDLLDQMTNKFEHMGTSILHRIEDMGDRIDNLEKSIGDLMDSQGIVGLNSNVGGASIKVTDEATTKNKGG